MATYHAKDLPDSPMGKHKDISKLKKDDYVQVTDEISFKVSSIKGVKYMAEKEDSDSNYEFDPVFETEEEKDKSLIQSPFIERRKSRMSKSPTNKPLNNSHNLLDVSADFAEVTDKYLELYEENKKSFTGRDTDASSEIDLDEENHPLPNIESNSIENEETVELKKLESAIIDSKILLENMSSNLNTQVNEWKEILLTETNIPKDDIGEIESLIGKSEMLLNKRVKNTFELINKADDYFIRGGKLEESSDKRYISEDVYGFVDLAKNELLKLNDDFKKVQQRRMENWPIVESNSEKSSKNVSNIENKAPRKKKLVKRSQTVTIASRLDIKEMQKMTRNKKKNKSGFGVQIMGMKNAEVTDENADLKYKAEKDKEEPVNPITPEKRVTRSQNVSVDFNNSTNTPNRSSSKNSLLSRSIRDHSRIITDTGVTVHADTPRPIKKQRTSLGRPKRSSISFKDFNDSPTNFSKDSFAVPKNTSVQLLKSTKKTRNNDISNSKTTSDQGTDSSSRKRRKLTDDE